MNDQPPKPRSPGGQIYYYKKKGRKNPVIPRKRGALVQIDPIRKPSDILKVKELLKYRARDYCMFVLGINTNLRPNDLLSIKVSDVKHLKPMESLVIKESKTGKTRFIPLNKTCIDAIHRCIQHELLLDTDYLFKQRKAYVKAPINTATLRKYIKQWCKDAGIAEGNYCGYTLRKTWGYHQRVTFGVSLPTLMVAFGHSSQEMTMRYLGITSDEVRETFSNDIGTKGKQKKQSITCPHCGRRFQNDK